MADPLVSVVVVTHNNEAIIPDCLAALQHTRYEPVELILVDNASTDGTLDYVREHAPEVRVIANDVGHGPGVAGNQGAEVARGELIVHLNSDVYVTPDWLSVMVPRMLERPQLGVLSPTTLFPGQERDGEPPAERVREVAAVPGCAMMVRRSAWEETGGFDPKFFLYWVDTEFCWRAWYLGWSVAEDLDAVVFHDEGGTTRHVFRAADQIENCLYANVKLMRWRQVAAFALAMAAKTLRWLPQRPGALLGAWRHAVRDLPETLAERRRWTALRRRHAPKLERMVVRHFIRQARERPQRRTLSASGRSTTA